MFIQLRDPSLSKQQSDTISRWSLRHKWVPTHVRLTCSDFNGASHLLSHKTGKMYVFKICLLESDVKRIFSLQANGMETKSKWAQTFPCLRQTSVLHTGCVRGCVVSVWLPTSRNHVCRRVQHQKVPSLTLASTWSSAERSEYLNLLCVFSSSYSGDRCCVSPFTQPSCPLARIRSPLFSRSDRSKVLSLMQQLVNFPQTVISLYRRAGNISALSLFSETLVS